MEKSKNNIQYSTRADHLKIVWILLYFLNFIFELTSVKKGNVRISKRISSYTHCEDNKQNNRWINWKKTNGMQFYSSLLFI